MNEIDHMTRDIDTAETPETRNLAVLCTLIKLPNGSTRVQLDDVQKGTNPGEWQHRTLVTFKDYPTGALEDPTSLPESELANFGFYVLSRLLSHDIE